MSSLFREEAVSHQHTKWLGQIVLINPVSTTLLTAVSLAVTAAVLGFLFWGEYTKKASVTGYLMPEHGLIKIYPPAAGAVLARNVQESARVRRGDVLYVLSTDVQNSTYGDTQAAIIRQVRTKRDSLHQELAQQKALLADRERALLSKRRYLEQELTQLADEITLQRQQVSLLGNMQTRFQDLNRSKFVSDLMLQDKMQEVVTQKLRLQDLERNATSLAQEISATRHQLASLPKESAARIAELERGIAATEQELAESEARRELLVTAPADGVATAIMAEPGQTVTPGTPVVSIIPAGDTLEAQLYAPSRAVGFIEPGKPVLLRYHAYPYQKFGQYQGVVKSISRTALYPSELQVPLSAAAAATPLYKITVSLAAQDIAAYGQRQPLQAGMQVDADVLLDRRRLIEWVLEPLYSLSGRYGAPSPPAGTRE